MRIVPTIRANFIPLSWLIISNPAHTNTTTELDKILPIFYIFIIPLLGVISNVFYRVNREGVASPIAQFSFLYLYTLPDDGRMKDRNMSQENNNKRAYSVRVLCLCGLDYQWFPFHASSETEKCKFLAFYQTRYWLAANFSKNPSKRRCIHQSTRDYIPLDFNLQQHLC